MRCATTATRRRPSPARRSRSRPSTARRSSRTRRMEPMNCTVKLTADRAECGSPRRTARPRWRRCPRQSGLPLDKCEVYKHILGGGFGRRGGAQDYVRQAVAIAKQFPGVPVKMIWSREEDMTHDFYRPISQCRLQAGHRRQRATSSACTSAFPASRSTRSTTRRRPRTARTTASCRATTRSRATRSSATPCPTCCIEYAMRNTHVPVGPWRGVNTNQNGVYLECFMDEVASAAGKDPLEFRRALMEQASEAPGRAQCRGGKGGLGHAAAGGRASRHRAVHGLRQLFGGGGRGLGGQGRQGQGAPHGAGAQLRARGQSRPDRRAGRRLGRVRPVGRALWRTDGRQGTHRREQLPHLPDPAARGDAQGRDGDRADVRFLGRRRRADDLRGVAGGAERDPRGDGQADAHAAARNPVEALAKA